MSSAYRHRRVIIQAFSPWLDPLHWSKVGTCPVKPFVVTVAPLAIMDQNFFFFVVNFLNVGSIPARLKSVVHDSGGRGVRSGTLHASHILISL